MLNDFIESNLINAKTCNLCHFKIHEQCLFTRLGYDFQKYSKPDNRCLKTTKEKEFYSKLIGLVMVMSDDLQAKRGMVI